MIDSGMRCVKFGGWKFVQVLLALVLTGSIVAVAGVAFMSRASTRRTDLGNRDGTLAVCPDSPNCVSSFATESMHFIPPITFDGQPKAALQTVVDIVSGMDGVRIVAKDDDYVHCEFSTPIFGFVDDLELVLDCDESVIHVRSASRVGHSDFGVNRKRVYEILRKFDGADSGSTHTTMASKDHTARVVTCQFHVGGIQAGF